jgi:S1-C subfamily serine protease
LLFMSKAPLHHSTLTTLLILMISGLPLALSVPASAIVNGREGAPLAASSLMVLNSKGGICSGLVIAPDVVLTAGHCVAGGLEIRVHYRDGEQAELLTPSTIAVHPEYRANAAAKRERSVDMALIRLEAPLTGFGNAPLATRQPRLGETVTVAGFGTTREGDARSTGTLRSAELGVVEPYGPGTILLWASPAAGKASGACQGDSGGVMSDADGRAVAVTSWSTGPGKSRCGALTQGVLLGAQRSWIDRTLGNWGRKALWFTNP